MRTVLFAAAAACLALPCNVSAQPPEIVVSPKPVQEWVISTSHQLDEALQRTDTSRADPGISIVRFTARADGTPKEVSTVLLQSASLDRVARSAVRQLRLEPMIGFDHHQVYEAAIVLGDSPEQLQSLRDRAAAYARERNERMAAKGLPNTAIALGAIAAF